jgi:transcriptional regulator with XRE-family HTH domain
MSRKPDRFQMTRELGRRLRGLRERAGLTQTELATLAGCGWDHALVSRLESGHYASPGLGLVADYLRACRASFADLADLLDAYTSQPRPVEKSGSRAVTRVTEAMPVKIGNQALKYDIKTTVARRADGKQPLSAEERVKRVLNLAAAATRRKRLDILVAHLIDEVGHGFCFTERQFVDRYARKVWGVLTSTRNKDQRLRVRRLARVLGDGIVAHVLPEAKVRLVRDRVIELFRAMEMTGKLATIPRPARPGPKRRPLEPKPGTLTPAMIARQANIGEGLCPVMAVIQTKDRPAGEAVALYLWLTELASAAYDTQPGSPEREEVLADALKDRPDSEQARRFAELALDGLDRQLRRK